MFLPAIASRYYVARVADTLVTNEVYLSLQGESTFAGLPCVFIRLTACNLRCSYCDTAYAFTEGSRRDIAEILSEVRRLAESYAGKVVTGHRLPLVELTGDPVADMARIRAIYVPYVGRNRGTT